jgi:hypothetical protein
MCPLEVIVIIMTLWGFPKVMALLVQQGNTVLSKKCLIKSSDLLFWIQHTIASGTSEILVKRALLNFIRS